MGMHKGYRAVSFLRQRSKEKRGGQNRHDDGLDRNGPTLATYNDQYLEWLRIHNRTRAAVESKRGALRRFLCWAAERDLIYPEQITRSILESYQRSLYYYRKKNGKPLGVSTQYEALNAVKVFFSWLCKQRLLEANPASELEMPKLPKRLPEDTPSVQEVEAILGMPDITDSLGIRDKAILELFYSTGMRRSELVNLLVGDLNEDRRTLFIRQGKGHKDRIVPVGTRAFWWLEKYLRDVRPLLLIRAEEQALFISAYGTFFNPDIISRTVRKYVCAAIPGRNKGSCHLLRHACATHMLEGGADLRYIQHLLGHANMDTTAIYAHVSIQQLQMVHAQTHPAETCMNKHTNR